MAASTFSESASVVARGFSISIGRPRSTAARIGPTCRCSSVQTITAVTSGPVEQRAVVLGDEVGADLAGHQIGAIGDALRDADPVDLRVAHGHFAAEQAHASGADDGEADALGGAVPHFALAVAGSVTGIPLSADSSAAM